MKLNRRPRNQRPGAFFYAQGFTLVELIAVVMVLAIIAYVAMPNLSSTDPAKLDAAAEVVAEGMRFARSEAMRRGKPIGFRQNNAAKRMRIFRVDTQVLPWNDVYDIYHPLSKHLWDIYLDKLPFAATDVVESNRIYKGTCNTKRTYFDAEGIAFCFDPSNVPLQRYEVTLTLGNHTRTVSLNGFNGKVKVQ